MAEFDIARTRKTLFGALLDARDRFGRNKVALEDLERQPITFGRLVLGSLVLGRKLAGLTKRARACRRAAAERAGDRRHPVRAQRLRARSGLPELHGRPQEPEGRLRAGRDRDHRHLAPLRRAGQARRRRSRLSGRGAGSSGSRMSARSITSLDKLRGLVEFLDRAARPCRREASGPTIRPSCCSPRARRACRRASCCRTPISWPTPIRSRRLRAMC